MPNLRMIRRRINAVNNIQQVTRAMKMIAASRMRKAQENILVARPYVRRLETLLRHIASRIPQGAHPLLDVRPVKKALLIVVAGDRGLCRGFNANAIRRTVERYGELKAQGVECSLIAVGRKPYEYFGKRGFPIAASHTGIFQHLNFLDAQEIASEATKLFLNRDADLVEIVYNEFKSVIQQVVVLERFLPVEPIAPEDGDMPCHYLYEPSLEAIWSSIVGKFVNLEIWRVLLESNAAEQSARMTAMEEATKSAEEMTKRLIGIRNQVRQTNITTELTEIVGAANALE
ncbi:MAG TPA: ATP synthase F1 subunit gamma [Candidatus Latescibacteria bacterium]|nr:ATP synthase F1 subunit gamma [Candidatus Latescibacterota bacterium]